MLGMTIRRVINYSHDVEKLRAARDLRALYVQRVAQHANENDFEQFKSSLERQIDPDAGVHIITLDDMRNGK